MNKKILHLTVDFPSINRPENTMAVKNLLSSLGGQEHLVIAMTRTANPFKTNLLAGDNVVSMRYWGLPFGIGLFLSMTIVACRVLFYLKKINLKPDAVHGHKFAFEGIAAWWLSRFLKVPFWVSVRGEADRKILKFKPYYKYFFQRLLNDCSHVFYVSAWFKPTLNDKFEIPECKQSLLPNFVSERDLSTTKEFNENYFVTVLDLNVYKKKGLDRLLMAMNNLAKRSVEMKLDIIGRGEPAVRHEVTAIIEKLGLSKQVRLLGVYSNPELLAMLPKYAGLLLPSHHETFGMVYVESLLSGVPILCSKNTGIDGFIDWVPAHIAVDPCSVESIANGIVLLQAEQNNYRDWLLKCNSEILAYFGRQKYIEHYQKLLVNE